MPKLSTNTIEKNIETCMTIERASGVIDQLKSAIVNSQKKNNGRCGVTLTKKVMKGLNLLQDLNVESMGNVAKIAPAGASSYVMKRIGREAKRAAKLGDTSINNNAPTLRPKTYSIHGLNIPYPFNKKSYATPEACKILIDNEARRQNKIIKFWMEKGYIPISMMQMYSMLRLYRSSPEKENIVWRKRGVKEIMTNTKFTYAFKKMKGNVGRAITVDDMKGFLKGAMITKAASDGGCVFFLNFKTTDAKGYNPHSLKLFFSKSSAS